MIWMNMKKKKMESQMQKEREGIELHIIRNYKFLLNIRLHLHLINNYNIVNHNLRIYYKVLNHIINQINNHNHHKNNKLIRKNKIICFGNIHPLEGR